MCFIFGVILELSCIPVNKVIEIGALWVMTPYTFYCGYHVRCYVVSDSSAPSYWCRIIFRQYTFQIWAMLLGTPWFTVISQGKWHTSYITWCIKTGNVSIKYFRKMCPIATLCIKILQIALISNWISTLGCQHWLESRSCHIKNRVLLGYYTTSIGNSLPV